MWYGECAGGGGGSSSGGGGVSIVTTDEEELSRDRAAYSDGNISHESLCDSSVVDDDATPYNGSSSDIEEPPTSMNDGHDNPALTLSTSLSASSAAVSSSSSVPVKSIVSHTITGFGMPLTVVSASSVDTVPPCFSRDDDAGNNSVAAGGLSGMTYSSPSGLDGFQLPSAAN